MYLYLCDSSPFFLFFKCLKSSDLAMHPQRACLYDRGSITSLFHRFLCTIKSNFLTLSNLLIRNILSVCWWCIYFRFFCLANSVLHSLFWVDSQQKIRPFFALNPYYPFRTRANNGKALNHHPLSLEEICYLTLLRTTVGVYARVFFFRQLLHHVKQLHRQWNFSYWEASFGPL